MKEAEAQLGSITALRDAERLQVRLELERARLAVRAAKATFVAANEALENARIREKLAEGRYQAGVGNAIELSDAVLALANAGGQRISALPSLPEIQRRAREALAYLPAPLLLPGPPAEPYPVTFSERILAAQAELRRKYEARHQDG